MAGGIDWFRWHHGSVTDPKFQLVARKAGARLSDVLAIWAYVLEHASAADVRGEFGDLDAEAIDCLFGFDDGLTAAVLDQMGVRGLVCDGVVSSWVKRQPKREREGDSSTERSRAFRQKQRHATPESDDATPRNATQRQETPRGEESREELIDAAQGAANKRGSRLPQDWQLPKAWGEWTLSEFKTWTPDVVRVEADKFRDFWCAKAGREAVKLDWLMTWRNWCRNAKPVIDLKPVKTTNIFAGAI